MSPKRCRIKGTKPVYVSMLGRSDTEEGWRANKGSGGLIMDVESEETVVSNLAMPHTPRLINNELYALLSARSELIKIDVGSGRYDVIKRFPGYVRGMAFYKGFLFIAFFKIREKHSAFSDLSSSHYD